MESSSKRKLPDLGGEVHIAMSSRGLKAKEVADFEKHGVKPVRMTVALDAIIPVLTTPDH